MERHENSQPAAKPTMAMNAEMQDVAKQAGREYAKGAAKEGGKQFMDYEKANGEQQYNQAQQKLDDAKAQAQGMWAKYCVCFTA